MRRQGDELVGQLRAFVTELAREEHLVATVTESLRGTMRSLLRELRDALHAKLEHLALATAAQVGVEARVLITEGDPAVVNDAGYVDRMRAAAGSGAEAVEMVNPRW